MTKFTQLFNCFLSGIILMFNLFNTGCAGPVFKLKPVDYYFADAKVQGLLHAALQGDSAAAQHWVAQGANPNAEGPLSDPDNRIRLLHYAIAADNVPAVRILGTMGADVEMLTTGSGNALDFAVYLQKPVSLGALLDVRPFQTISPERAQITLFGAADTPSTDCLELLLQRGFPIDLKDSLGRTALMNVIASYDADRAEWLINHGASIFIEERNGSTPTNMIQDDLSRVKPGTESEKKLLHLKSLMQAKGAVFPTPTPAENRARRAANR